MPNPLPPGTAVQGVRYGVRFTGTVRRDHGDDVSVNVDLCARYGWRAVLDVPRDLPGCQVVAR